MTSASTRTAPEGRKRSSFVERLSNPAYAQVSNEHTWSQGWMDIIQGGMTAQAAAEKAFKRIEEIFAKYPIAAS